MMDALVTTALVGTAQQPNIEITTGTAVDALTQGLADGEAEHKLLLSAGTRAICRQAGTIAETLPSIPEPAAPETLPVCTPAIATLLENMLKGEYSNLLREALERMQQAGQRVPHIMVATILNKPYADLRSAIYPVLGERGRWLSQFNPAWSWVSDHLSEAQDEGLTRAESTWQEGTLGQRVRVLYLLRRSESAKAREWFAEVWTQEKAEVRAKLLATFEVGLSPDDEEFLEKALDDRAADVRSTAASLLARLPTSAFGRRMQERADAMLSYAAGKLTVSLPTTLEKDWLRDGIRARVAAVGDVCEHTWWFSQVILHVPPAHWVEHFGTSMDKLLAAAEANKDWHETIGVAWSIAARLHNDAQWCMALWDCWGKKQPDTFILKDAPYQFSSLFSCMPQPEAEQRVLSMFSNPNHPWSDWRVALSVLPTPWSKEFGEAYLQELRTHVASLDFKPDTQLYSDPWYQSIRTASTALPSACFAQAMQSWTVSEVPVEMAKKAVWREYWQQELRKFVEAIRIRQQLIEEIG